MMRSIISLALLAPALLAAQDPKASGAIGVVIDSIHGRPLWNATILVEGTRLSEVSSTTGEFRFDSIPPGTRRFVLRHPVVDSIGFEIVSPPIELVAGRVTLVALAVASRATLRRLLRAPRGTAGGGRAGSGARRPHPTGRAPV